MLLLLLLNIYYKHNRSILNIVSMSYTNIVVTQITINYYAKQNKHNHLKTAEREEKQIVFY